MSYYNTFNLNNNFNIGNHFISFLQLFFFNKTLYSFFNTFCRNGKKGLTLKLVLLLLNNLKNKTLLSPILILKSVILNNKLFFKINETKFRRKTFYSITHLDPEHQVSYSIGSLNRYLKHVVLNNQSNLVDTLTKFFLSFFLKDDLIYKNYINRIIDSNQNINEIFSDLDEFEDRSISRSKDVIKNSSKLYLNTLFNKYLGKFSKKGNSDKVILSSLLTNEDKTNSSIMKVNPAKGNLSKVIKKSKYNNKVASDLKREEYNNKKVFKLDGININFGNEDFVDTSLEYLDISDIRLNQYFKNYVGLKNKIIYYFLSDRLNSLYLLIESVYNSIFNFTVDNILDDAIFTVGKRKDNLDVNLGTEKSNIILDRIRSNFHSEVDNFILWLIHVELKSNIGVDFLHLNKSGFIYKWMLYDRSIISYLYRYYLQFYKIFKNFTVSNTDHMDINSLISSIDSDSSSVVTIYRKNIFDIFRNYIEVLKRMEVEKERKKEMVRKLKEKEEKKKLVSNIKNSFKRKIFINISKSVNRILPNLVSYLDLTSNTFDYKKPRKYISYKFKRMRVIGYH